MSYPWQATTVVCNKLQILKYITYNSMEKHILVILKTSKH